MWQLRTLLTVWRGCGGLDVRTSIECGEVGFGFGFGFGFVFEFENLENKMRCSHEWEYQHALDKGGDASMAQVVCGAEEGMICLSVRQCAAAMFFC